MRHAVMAALLAISARGAESPPQFSAAGVSAPILSPGAILSIYGEHLAPPPGCSANPDSKLRETVNPRNPDPGIANLSVYPRELCGVQVMIGDKPAGMLFVSPGQINFKVPQDSAEAGTVELRVIYQGQSGTVLMPAGFGETTISLAEPAYVGMPVWLKVERRQALGHILYPSLLGPAGFGCDQVEVRRDGKLLPQLPGSNWMKYGMGYSGGPCGTYGPQEGRILDRLPLHLLYRFDEPGVYEVRYTHTSAIGARRGQVRAQSGWISIQVLPPGPGQRQEFLEGLRRRAVSASEAALLSDILPEALGFSDDASFELVTAHLYHPSQSVRRYAMNGLSYWPEDAASAKLLVILHEKGPSEELVRFLLRQTEYGAAHRDEIVAASLPYLDSDSAVAVGGTLTALRWPPGTISPATFEALLRSAEHILQHADAQTRADLLQSLAGLPSGKSGDPRVHVLLQKFVDQGYDEAAQPLTTFRDPADLSRLAALFSRPGLETSPVLPEEMYAAYGQASVPYLKDELRTSASRFTAGSLARELMALGEPEGFQYALSQLNIQGGLRTAMIQSLKSQFPELRDSSDDAVVLFVKSRAGN